MKILVYGKGMLKYTNFGRKYCPITSHKVTSCVNQNCLVMYWYKVPILKQLYDTIPAKVQHCSGGDDPPVKLNWGVMTPSQIKLGGENNFLDIKTGQLKRVTTFST